MPKHNLTESLQALVHRHGMSSVLHSLADIQDSAGRQTLSSRHTRNSKSKLSAVDYIGRLTLPTEKSEVMARAAQRFEEGKFLPSIADVREFCRIHGVELGKATSRAGTIPRVFTFLATMDTAQVAKVLDDGSFSGPSRLAPIADAIRNRSANRRQPDFTEVSSGRSELMTSDKSRSERRS